MDVSITSSCLCALLTALDDGTLIAGLQAFPTWNEDLNYPAGARLGLLNAIGYIAGFFVGPVIAYIDDNFGRKWGIRCESSGSFCMPSSLCLQSTEFAFWSVRLLVVSPESLVSMVTLVSSALGSDRNSRLPLVFLVGRVILGLGLAAYLITSQVMIQEVPHPRSRGVVAQSWVCSPLPRLGVSLILRTPITSWVQSSPHLSTLAAHTWRLPGNG